ncbi:MAG: anhydro-N-acetylmuramic acid kinase [Bacteroidota bacterium]|nr:anhydro-N-acetylmuramic acid kinase [Bacteroidota bacterium]
MTITHNKNTFYVIGLMSGTSLDGLDIAYCKFEFNDDHIIYEIIEATTVEYPEFWLDKFASVRSFSGLELTITDRQLGVWMALQINNFIQANNIIKIDFISSHGHTVFHVPSEWYTLQIGNGASIAAITHYPVVCDFRSLDVALGGQGAPLVPMGDKILFSKYDFCLNLGGIANISYSQNDTLKAFDICPANMALNYLASQLGFAFDNAGQLGAKGKVNEALLNQLNDIDFYTQKPPKSLGIEGFNAHFKPILDRSSITIYDKLATVCEHIAVQIKVVIDNNDKNSSQMLVTGGGAFNVHLINTMQHLLGPKCKIIIPDEKTVKFKEALIFALLGLYRWLGKENCIASVTGASKNNIGGCIYLNN